MGSKRPSLLLLQKAHFHGSSRLWQCWTLVTSLPPALSPSLPPSAHWSLPFPFVRPLLPTPLPWAHSLAHVAANTPPDRGGQLRSLLSTRTWSCSSAAAIALDESEQGNHHGQPKSGRPR